MRWLQARLRLRRVWNGQAGFSYVMDGRYDICSRPRRGCRARGGEKIGVSPSQSRVASVLRIFSLLSTFTEAAARGHCKQSRQPIEEAKTQQLHSIEIANDIFVGLASSYIESFASIRYHSLSKQMSHHSIVCKCGRCGLATRAIRPIVCRYRGFLRLARRRN